jgi:hypothetical protein
MSLNFTQILDLIDDNVKTNSTTYTTADKTRDVNLALDRALALIFQVGGTWQFDDANHSANYPIITTNIVSGQRDYSFTEDGSGNLILEIHKVWVADENGLFRVVSPVDLPNSPSNYWDGLNTQGIPNTYDKLANGIFLDPIPNYNRTNGLKLEISREGYYFTVSDTTRKPGIAGLFHEYLALRPSFQYAYRNGMKVVSKLEEQVLRMEDDIREFYKSREKDVQKKVVGLRNSSR